MTNFIYKLSVIDRDSIPYYDVTFGVVIIAKSEEEARYMIINEHNKNGNKIYGDEGKKIWENPEQTKCELLGTTEHPIGIIAIEFNAG